MQSPANTPPTVAALEQAVRDRYARCIAGLNGWLSTQGDAPALDDPQIDALIAAVTALATARERARIRAALIAIGYARTGDALAAIDGTML